MGIFNKQAGKKNVGLPAEENTIYSPVAGELIALSDFPDAVFSEGILGNGCGIRPGEEIIKAPFNGEVVQLQECHHALGLLSDDGIELLIHVGVDTVSLKRKGFVPLVKQGDKIVMGQEILRFNIADIKAAGLFAEVAVIVTNSDDYGSVNVISPGAVAVSTQIIRAER